MRGALPALLIAVAAGPLLAFAEDMHADTAATVRDDDSASLEERSPWLVTPIFNSNPKLGTSFGALGGYLHYFDAKSRPSIFAVSGQYTSTDSVVAGAFARASFDEDRQRLIAGLVYGNIKNDYDDYLGTGVPLKNEADLGAAMARYSYRIAGDWFFGGQAIYQNFSIAGQSPFDDEVLDLLGIEPYKSAGAGLVLQHDSRDDENMPTSGWLLNLNNIAFRETWGGEDDYDVYRLDIRYFMPHGKGHVLAVRQLNHFTRDAPLVARAPVQLRGYKIGEYNGEYMSSIEAEERYRFSDKWTGTVFAGVACVYGDSQHCSDSENVFPAWGAGLQYILKPREGIVVNLEYAQGKSGNYGFYLKLGYGY